MVSGLAGCAGLPPPPVRIEGTVWQPDAATAQPRGDWQRLGATALLVQWTAVSGAGFVNGCGLPPATAPLPDWPRIAAEPWAARVVLGLAGAWDEGEARRDAAALGALSQCLAALPTPLAVDGYYFPVEADPTWDGADALGPVLAQLQAVLPRPLWVSVHDSANHGPAALVRHVQRWLPPGTGVYLQDGVGVHARDPATVRGYVDALRAALGPGRVRLIAEAFRPRAGGGFRPATAAELRSQLGAYRGLGVWLFDGPHYLDAALVDELLAKP